MKSPRRVVLRCLLSAPHLVACAARSLHVLCVRGWPVVSVRRHPDISRKRERGTEERGLPSFLHPSQVQPCHGVWVTSRGPSGTIDPSASRFSTAHGQFRFSYTPQRLGKQTHSRGLPCMFSFQFASSSEEEHGRLVSRTPRLYSSLRGPSSCSLPAPFGPPPSLASLESLSRWKFLIGKAGLLCGVGIRAFASGPRPETVTPGRRPASVCEPRGGITPGRAATNRERKKTAARHANALSYSQQKQGGWEAKRIQAGPS